MLDGLARTSLAILIFDGVHAEDLGWMPVPYPPTEIGDGAGDASVQNDSSPNAES